MNFDNLFPDLDKIFDELDKKIEKDKKKLDKKIAIAKKEIEKLEINQKQENQYVDSKKKNKSSDPQHFKNVDRPTYGGTKKNVPYRHGILNGKGPVSINGYGIRMSDGRIS